MDLTEALNTAVAAQVARIVEPLRERVSALEKQLEDRARPEVLTEREAAVYLRVSLSLLRQMRMKGSGPRYVKMGRGRRGAVRYRRQDLDSWTAERRIRSTAETRR